MTPHATWGGADQYSVTEPEVKSHWPNLNSIDLAQREGDGDNISEGEPALASADGVVSAVYTTAPPKDAPELGGENRVFIDHGNGWTTYYIHLQSLPPLKVGQHVAQGEQIGTVGKSGAASPHLHYTQLADGVAVRVRLNGQDIATWEGDKSTWKHVRQRREAHQQQLSGPRVPALRPRRHAQPARLRAGQRRGRNREHLLGRVGHREPLEYDGEPAHEEHWNRIRR